VVAENQGDAGTMVGVEAIDTKTVVFAKKSGTTVVVYDLKRLLGTFTLRGV
jgi:hypothetical protein